MGKTRAYLPNVRGIEQHEKGYLAMPGPRGSRNDGLISKGRWDLLEGTGAGREQGSMEVDTGGTNSEGNLNKCIPGTQFSVSRSGKSLSGKGMNKALWK